MIDPAVLAFWALAALGAWVQTTTGFALGLIVMSGATLFGLLPVPVTAAVISILVLVNGAMVLSRDHHAVDRGALVWATLASLPGIALGLWLLHWLGGARLDLLRGLLGVFIAVAALQLVARPHPWGARSPNAAFGAAGAAGGVLGGLFATSGPPLIWLIYRQPLPLATIRTTLVAYFTATQAWRLALVTGTGGFDRAVLLAATGAVPAILMGTWAARRYPPPVAALTIRRAALVLLFLSGVALIATALA